MGESTVVTVIHAPAVTTQALGEKPESRVVAGIDLTQPPWHVDARVGVPGGGVGEDMGKERVGGKGRE